MDTRVKIQTGKAAHFHDPRDIQRGSTSAIQPDIQQFADLRRALAGGSEQQFSQPVRNAPADAIARTVATRVQFTPWIQEIVTNSEIPVLLVRKNPQRLSLEFNHHLGVDPATTQTFFVKYSWGYPVISPSGAPLGHTLFPGGFIPSCADGAVSINDLYVWVYEFPRPSATTTLMLAYEGTEASEANQ